MRTVTVFALIMTISIIGASPVSAQEAVKQPKNPVKASIGGELTKKVAEAVVVTVVAEKVLEVLIPVAEAPGLPQQQPAPAPKPTTPTQKKT